MNKIEGNSDVFLKITNYSIPKWKDLPEIDLYMDQVIVLMEKYLSDSSTEDTKLITPSMINNYVKLGIMPAPIKKKYSREHLAYLIIICSLKQVISISNIKAIIDQKLEKNTIAETLDFYSNLYNFATNTVSETYKTHISSENLKLTSSEDTALFTAIIATNCINISNELFQINNLEKTKTSNKRNKKEN